MVMCKRLYLLLMGDFSHPDCVDGDCEILLALFTKLSVKLNDHGTG